MPQSATCLVVDDEPHIRRAVRNALDSDFARIIEAATGGQAVDLAAAERPAMIVLDLALPDGSGLDVCREVRRWSAAPIIVLSARQSERDKVELLDAGADDYVTKPFSPVELRARVRAQLRRAALTDDVAGRGRVQVGGLVIDLLRRVVAREDQEIHLTPTEWAILQVFVRHAGKTLTHAQLFHALGPRSSGDPQQYLRVYVAQLRRKIEEDVVRPRLIVTEPGVGYRFTAAD